MMATVEGVDCDTILTKADATCMFNAGKYFVGRYYRDNGASGGGLSNTEVSSIHQGGLKIVSLYFASASDGGTNAGNWTNAQGQTDGTNAVNQAKLAGQPSSTPIYCDIESNQTWSTVQNYVNGWLAVLANNNWYYEPAFYGTPKTIDSLSQNLGAEYWIAQIDGTTTIPTAPAGGQIALKQYAQSTQSNPIALCGINVDLDSALWPDLSNYASLW